ncbi:MAG: DUF3883 domain-containing protein, partial [Actinomycetota bacterium]|nr:DUF3883 domain-containing protein [Actinomycetota bacterium]
YGEQPLVKERLKAVVDSAVGDALREVVHERALVSDVMTWAEVERIRDEMERAEARKLQPHFIRSFFLQAFGLLGGTVREREPGRYEITHVPAELRRRDRQIGLGAPMLRRYERVTFEKELIAVESRPVAQYITRGHPLLDGTIDLIIERYDTLLRQGAVLIDESDPEATPRMLIYLQHSVVDGRTDSAGNRRVVSKRFEFVEVDPDGAARHAGWAPYLDCRPAQPEELGLLRSAIESDWVRADLENKALDHGIELARVHLDEVRRRTLDRVERTAAAVRERLLSQIQHWDHRANQLKDRELAGNLPKSGMNSAKARQRANELEARLKRRLEELDGERQLGSLPPVVAGGALVVPAGLLTSMLGTPADEVAEHAQERSDIDRAAVDAVLATERRIGRQPTEMATDHKGYDIESKDPAGNLWFIEVKGRMRGEETFTSTRSEIGVAGNKPDQHILALVEVRETGDTTTRYIRRAFADIGDLPFDTTSVNFNWKTYFERAEEPA